MSVIPRGPGRPRKPDAPGAAERMRASRQRRRNAGLRLSQAWVNAALPVYSDHQRLDARSLAMHSLLARKLMANPELIDLAREKLLRWKAGAPRPAPPCFAEWARILKRRPVEVAGFLVEMSENATRLRQSSPFAPLLTPAERDMIYAAFR